MKHLKTFENQDLEKNRKRFKKGENVYSTAFKKMYKIIDVTGNTICIEDENGNQAEFLIKDFIPEIEYTINKFNL